MNMLLHCDVTNSFPSYWNGGKGLPVATNPLPFVHVVTSSGLHSDLEVGFESAKMIGCSVFFPNCLRISSSKSPLCAVTPMRTVAFEFRTTSASLITPGLSRFHPA